MNEIAKFVAIICVLYASYVLCEKCEANPSNGFCGKYVSHFRWMLIFEYVSRLYKILENNWFSCVG